MKGIRDNWNYSPREKERDIKRGRARERALQGHKNHKHRKRQTVNIECCIFKQASGCWSKYFVFVFPYFLC